ncbi:MAG TPA: fibronectin type III domain-containing protein, partial [Candidatus Dojkabacteria bacterium]|nr:fibronectin type III domain-containing protein [Candidatus Dojkabacteria bacterium]
MVTQDQTADVTTQNVTSTSKKLILSKWWFYILLVLFIAIIGGIAIYLINQNNAKDISNFQITSITSESAAISWTTTKPTSSIVYLTDKNENKLFDFITGYKYFDFRDYQEISPNQFVKVDQGKYYNHYVVVSGLESSKEYSIAISDFVLPIDKFSQKFKTYSELETMTTP